MALQGQALTERLQGGGLNTELLPTNPCIGPLLTRLKGIRTLIQGLLFFLRLCRALYSFQVVHVLAASYWYFWLRVIPTVVVARMFGRRVIINYRGGEAREFFERFAPLVLPILRRADSIVVPSHFLQRIFEEYGFHPVIISNFVDHGRFRYRQRDRLNPILLVTRSLEPLYNVKMALQSFAIIQHRYPKASLDVVGGGSEERALQEWVRQEGLSGVRFHGAVPNEQIPNFLANTDILLNPTNADNMPLNLLEAFAAGVPVVTTDVGGIPDLLGPVEAALLVKPNDPVAMAERIEELLCRPELVIKLTQRARTLSEQASWMRVGQLWRDVYDGRPGECSAQSDSAADQSLV